jgi:hypothetical protein
MKNKALVLLFWVLSLQNAIHTYAQCSPNFYDGFESGSYSPTWTMGSGLTSGAVTTTNPANGTYRLEGTGGVSSHLTGFSTTIAAATPSIISWWIYPTGTGASNYVVLGDGAVTATNCISFCYWQGGTNIRFVSSSTAVYNCTPNQWYHIEMRNVNFTTHTFDIYINNNLIQANFPFRSSTQNTLSNIHLYNFNNAVGVWDDVTIGGAPISLSQTNTPSLCNGQAMGSINLTATSTNAGALTYAWSNAANTEDVSGLLAGTYSVLVTDGLGCQDSITNITITEPTAIVSDTTSTPVTCFGDADGTASITVTGGTPGYTYVWSNGSITPSINLLNGGYYECTVTDANGCTHVNSVIVTQPAAMNANFNSTTPSCFGDVNGSTSIVMTGGTPGYSYLWSTTETTPTISNLAPGWYYCTTTDTNNCTHQDSVYIAEPALLNADLATASNPTSCNGNEGAIDINISGGTPGYTYLWNNGNTTEDPTGLIQGGYTVTVTDANGCTDSYTTTLTDPTPTVVTLNIPEDTVCLTNSAFNLTGASAAGGVFSGAGVTGGSFTPSVAGVGTQNITYNYTDANNCVSMAQDVIVVIPCLGLENEGTNEVVRLYPNPASSFIYVDIVLPGVPVNVTLVNELGQMMDTHTLIDQHNMLNIESYPAGIYYVQISQGQEMRVEKIMVK